MEVFCEENIADGKTDLPEELQYRHLTKTQSGTLVWVGNNVIHDMINVNFVKSSPSMAYHKKKCQSFLQINFF